MGKILIKYRKAVILDMENENKEVNGMHEQKINLMNRVISGIIYMVLSGVFFFFGYQIGHSTVPESTAAVMDEAVINTDVMAEIWYEVAIRDDRLCLYRVNGNEYVLLAGEEISTELYPYDDRKELYEGIVFETFDAAQARFEDFVS